MKNKFRIPSRQALVVMALFAGLGTWLLINSLAQTVTAINEDFSVDAANFQVVSGGNWTVSGGTYNISNPAAATDPQHGLYNLSLHKAPTSGDFNLTVDASTVSTASVWNDFAVVFGYHDANNYYYAVFNEQSDNWTNGIFRIVNGTQTKIANFNSTILAGTTYSINIIRSGSNITVLRDGQQQASVSDSTFMNGQIGLGSRDDAATFDNLRVNIPDTTAPTVPTGLRTVSTTNTSASIAWSASTDNVTVAGYKVYRQGVNIATVSTPAFTDSNLTASTSYSYTVSAYDASGNVSAQSSPLSLTTQATSSGVPPSTVDPSLLFYGNFETGNLTQWSSNQSCPWGTTVVANPLRAGKYSVKFQVDDTDTHSKCAAVPNTGNPRAQLTSKALFKNGSEAYVGLNLFLPTGFSTNIPGSAALQFMELYGSPYGGGPTIGMYLYGNNSRMQISYKNSSGSLIYKGVWLSSTSNTIGTAWQNYILHVKFSPDKTIGYVELWYNGQRQTLTDPITLAKTQTLHMATLVKGVNWDGTSTGTNALYINSYRKKGTIPGTVTFYQDEAKVGPTYLSVQP